MGNLSRAGLQAPSVVRGAKIATIEAGDATRLGKVSAGTRRKVITAIARELGLTAPSR